MVAKKKRGQPAPAPRTELSRRLEQVRAFRRVETLLDFHETLTAATPNRPGFDVSYSAIRNYHYDRDPPLAYLQRVADVFDVSLGWLVTGAGSVAGKEAGELIRSREEIDMRADPLARRVNGTIAPHVGALFAQTVMLLWMSDGARYGYRHPEEGPSYEDVAEDVARMLMEPWDKWLGFMRPAGAEFESYAVAMLSALLLTGAKGVTTLGEPPEQLEPAKA